MQQLNKEQIRTKLADKIQRLNISNNYAAKQMRISSATLTHVLNNTWKSKPELSPSDQMWRQIATWAGVNSGWQTAETSDFKRIHEICTICQNKSISRALSAAPGTGKTYALKEFASSYPEVFYIECDEYWSKRVFLNSLREAMGLIEANYEGGNIYEMTDEIIRFLNKKQSPLVIIDEFDKLKDPVMNFFKTFYNKTHSGFLLAGAPYLQKRIIKGARLQKQTYQEIFSRIGAKFFGLNGIDDASITLICKANSIIEPIKIQEVINCSLNDLRCVKMEIDRIINNKIIA